MFGGKVTLREEWERVWQKRCGTRKKQSTRAISSNAIIGTLRMGSRGVTINTLMMDVC